MKKLVIVSTHPIQYNAPLFRLLAQRKKIEVKVFYTWGQAKEEVFDARFGINRKWDIPLLDSYDFEFVQNTSSKPDSNRFLGIINPGLRKKILASKPDVVLIYKWSVWSHLWLLLRGFGKIPVFFRGDSFFNRNLSSVKLLMKKFLLRVVYSRVDKALAVGSYNYEYYKKTGLSSDQIITIPHAVDNSRFTEHENEFEMKAQEMRLKLGIPADGVVFLFAGKFYPVKNLPVLINTFKKAAVQNQYLILVGNGEQEQLLREMADDHNRILFDGFRNQSEMPWVYRVGDVFVLPSKSETWGLGVNEAMACSRPALVSNNCGCAPELIVQDTTGWLFHSESELATVFSKLNNRKQILNKGLNALQHVQKFSLEHAAEMIEQLMNKQD